MIRLWTKVVSGAVLLSVVVVSAYVFWPSDTEPTAEPREADQIQEEAAAHEPAPEMPAPRVHTGTRGTWRHRFRPPEAAESESQDQRDRKQGQAAWRLTQPG
ncbi:MAG: hypothetical protein ACYTEQ_24985, partial [Planctomycetota bacterium]